MKRNNLHNIKSTGYKTPEDYFDSLEDAIFSKLSVDHISSKFHTTGFKVPESYFETLDAKILKNVSKNRSASVIPIFNWKKVAYLSGIAASLVLAFNIFFNNSNSLTFDDLETASIENYLMNEDLNADDIAPYMSTNELNAANFVETKINTSDIEDYLLQNSDVEHLITD